MNRISGDWLVHKLCFAAEMTIPHATIGCLVDWLAMHCIALHCIAAPIECIEFSLTFCVRHLFF
jgi:hypothetical protein